MAIPVFSCFNEPDSRPTYQAWRRSILLHNAARHHHGALLNALPALVHISSDDVPAWATDGGKG